MSEVVELLGSTVEVVETETGVAEVIETETGVTEVIEIAGAQGPTGPKGDSGEVSGDIPSDPLAYYILSKS